MKKLLSVIAVAMVVSLMFPVIASACSKSTNISGTIYFNSSPVGRKVTVTITCNNHVRKIKTDRHGYYSISYPFNSCRTNSTIVVAASYNGLSGSQSGIIKKCNNRINVYIEYVTVPELGLVTGIFAMCISCGFILLIRSRILNSNI